MGLLREGAGDLRLTEAPGGSFEKGCDEDFTKGAEGLLQPWSLAPSPRSGFEPLSGSVPPSSYLTPSCFSSLWVKQG